MRWALLLPAIVAAAACGRSGALEGDDGHRVPTPHGPPSMPPPSSTPTPGPFCDDAGVIACWHFDGDLDEESPNAFVISDGGIGFDSDGAVDKAVELDLTSFMTLPGIAAWVPSASPISFEMWVNPETLPAAGTRYGLIDRANGGGYSLFLYPNGTVRCGSRAQVYASNAAPAATWTHIACVDDTLATSVWINGDFVAEAAGSTPLVMTTSGQKVYLGENGPEGNDQLVGMMDELRFLDRALSPPEVRASFERGE